MGFKVGYIVFVMFVFLGCSHFQKTKLSCSCDFVKNEIRLMQTIANKIPKKTSEVNKRYKGILNYINRGYFNIIEIDFLLEANVQLILTILLGSEKVGKNVEMSSIWGYKGIKIKTLNRLRKEYLIKKNAYDNIRNKYFLKISLKTEKDRYKWVDEMIEKFGKKYIEDNLNNISIILYNRKYLKLVPNLDNVVDDYSVALMKYLKTSLIYFNHLSSALQYTKGNDKNRVESVRRLTLFISVLRKIEAKMFHWNFTNHYYVIEENKTLYEVIDLKKLKKFISKVDELDDVFYVMSYIRKKIGIAPF